jgi:hypothetical protein
MERWGYANRFFPISRTQFVTQAARFLAEFAKIAGETRLDVALYEVIPWRRTTVDTDETPQERRDRLNAGCFRVLGTLDDLTEADWARAAYVVMTVTPVGGDPVCFANVEAKGRQPKEIGFYVQGNDALGLPDTLSDIFGGWRQGYRRTDGYNPHVNLSVR